MKMFRGAFSFLRATRAVAVALYIFFKAKLQRKKLREGKKNKNKRTKALREEAEWS